MALQTKTYYVTNVANLTAKFEQMDGPAVDFSKPTGTVETHNCNLSWSIAGAAVTITVLSKPFYVSYGQIWNSLTELFAGG